MSRTGYQRMRAEVAAGVWRSGWCGEGNPASSHARCVEHPRPDGRKCRCVCHQKAAVEADLTGLHTDMSNADYHAQTDWLSSTQLKRALPEHYKTGGSQEALDFGTLVHTVVLEPDSLDGYVVLDAAAIAGDNPKTGRPYDNPTMTAKYKAAKAEVEADGKVVVAREDWDAAHAMRDAIAAHPTASRLLLGDDGVSEESAFVTDESGLQHKARFDRRVPGAIIDLKTTSAKPGRDSLTRTVIDYGYETSAVHYLTVADLLGLDVSGFGWVFVDKSPDHRVTVVDVDAAFLERGKALRDKAIRRLADPAEPRYEGATGFLTLTCPRWAELEQTA